MSKLGKTALFYRKNKESYRKKLAKANSHPVWGEQTAKRKRKKKESAAKRKKENERRKKNGQPPLPKTVHYDHLEDCFKSESSNTGQKEKSRKVGSKRNKGMFGRAIKKLMS